MHRGSARWTRRSVLAGLAAGVGAFGAGCGTTDSDDEDGPGEDEDLDGEDAQRVPLPADGVGIDRIQDRTFRETPETNLALNLSRPDDGLTRPLLVHVHGGAWRFGTKGYAFAERMARAGMAVASVEYRLSHQATYPAAVRDVVAAIQWLRAHAAEFTVDPERVALLGESAGGHLIALVASAPDHPNFQPEGFEHDAPVAVDALVPISGIYDFGVGQECQAEITQQFLGGDCGEIPERAREASPVTHVDGGHPPVLCFHAPEDPIVGYEQATAYRDSLRSAGVDVELYTAEDGTHLLSNHAEAFLPEQRRFLQSHLGIERGTSG